MEGVGGGVEVVVVVVAAGRRGRRRVAGQEAAGHPSPTKCSDAHRLATSLLAAKIITYLQRVQVNSYKKASIINCSWKNFIIQKCSNAKK